MPRSLTRDEFVKKSNEVHNNFYDYSKTVYENVQKLVEIICPEHGEFWLPPCKHFKGRKCPSCSGSKLNTKEFINRANKKHNYKFDYSKTDYKGIFEKVEIICPEHGEFKQTPDRHLNSGGCLKCGIKIASDKKTYTTEEFIKMSKCIHGNKYDYSLTNYKHNKEPVLIICPEHGEFKQTPNAHTVGKGCIRCSESHGEREIYNLLSKNNINFETQKKFNGCKNKAHLPFDFYLPDHNICIEFDGEQHYKAIEWFGGGQGFKERKKNDNLKTEYCKINNIKLIRIKFNQNINERLKTNLFFQ